MLWLLNMTWNRFDENMLKQMIVKCIEEVNYIVVDWKGLGKERKRIMKLVEDTGLDVLKV